MGNNIYWTDSTSVSGSLLVNSTENSSMSEISLSRFTVKFKETVVKEYTHDILAKSHEDAVDRIKLGKSEVPSTKILSVERVEVK